MVIEMIVIYGLQGREYRDGLDSLLVLLIGGIPIAMPTVLSVTMAIGSHRLSQQVRCAQSFIQNSALKIQYYLVKALVLILLLIQTMKGSNICMFIFWIIWIMDIIACAGCHNKKNDCH